MVYPAGGMYARFVFDEFQQGAAIDVATFGFHLVAATTPGPTDLGAFATFLRDLWNDSDLSTPEWYSPSVKGNHVDVYTLGTDGKATDKGSAAFSGGDAWTGTASTGLPSQDALAISTYAFNPDEYQTQPGRHRGRFYLPPMGAAALNSDGNVTTTVRNGCLDAAAAFFADIAAYTQGSASANPSIQSKSDQTYRLITYVRAGIVVDTQRRRRSKMNEYYSSVAITP